MSEKSENSWKTNPRFLAQQWKKGVSPYKEFLKNLSPEEYAEHLEQRRKRKQMKRMMEEVVQAQAAGWVAMFNNAAVKLLERAVETGDAQAFMAVYDRIIGKPTLNIDAELAEKPTLPWHDDD